MKPHPIRYSLAADLGLSYHSIRLAGAQQLGVGSPETVKNRL